MADPAFIARPAARGGHMTRLSHDADAPRAEALGLIALRADETIEHDFRRLLPDTVDLMVSRIPSAPELTPETLGAMEAHLAAAAALLPPVAFRALGYGCTSAAAWIGAARVAGLLRQGARAGMT